MGFDTVHPITREGLAITNLFVVVLVLSAVVLLVVLLPLGDGGLEHPWLLAGCQLSLPGDDASLVVPEVSCLQVFCAPEPWAAAGCAAACRAMRGGCTDTRRRPPLERALPARGR